MPMVWSSGLYLLTYFFSYIHTDIQVKYHGKWEKWSYQGYASVCMCVFVCARMYMGGQRAYWSKVWAVLSNSAYAANSPPEDKVYFQETLWGSILLQARGESEREGETHTDYSNPLIPIRKVFTPVPRENECANNNRGLEGQVQLLKEATRGIVWV